ASPSRAPPPRGPDGAGHGRASLVRSTPMHRGWPRSAYRHIMQCGGCYANGRTGGMPAEPPTAATRVRRHPERGRYEREVVDAILDAALVSHVGFAHERPFVIPTIHARDGDTLYLHGSPGSRLLRTLERGPDVCVTATVIDGIVLARSLFHLSLNYRSAVVLGRARLVSDDEEKRRALNAVADHVMPGRAGDSRDPS